MQILLSIKRDKIKRKKKTISCVGRPVPINGVFKLKKKSLKFTQKFREFHIVNNKHDLFVVSMIYRLICKYLGKNVKT